MRYPASEKLEIIGIVEQSHLPAKQTLDRLGIARRTFYRWYDHYLEGGPEALADKPSAPSRVWNRIPADIHDQIIELAQEQSEPIPIVGESDSRRGFPKRQKSESISSCFGGRDDGCGDRLAG